MPKITLSPDYNLANMALYKRSIGLFILFAFLSYICLYLKLKFTPCWFNGTLEQNHQALLNFCYTNNEQSRLLQFYIPELFRYFGLDIISAYKLQRYLFTLITFCIFYKYLRKWFTGELAMGGVIAYCAIMPLAYQNDLQESSSLLALTFLLALWAIREENEIHYMIILWVGSINNETMLFLPALHFLERLNKFTMKEFLRIGSKSIFYALPALISVGIIRYITRDNPHLGGAWHWHENMHHLYSIFIIFGPLWIFALFNFPDKPKFIQRALFSIPLFILPHLVTGIIYENRQMLPLSFIIIPAAFYYMFKDSQTKEDFMNL